MGLGFLTRDQIINQGLLQAGNLGLAATPAGFTESPAVTFFKTFIHHVALNYDHPVFQLEGAITLAANDYVISLSGLTRYRSIKAVRLATLSGVLDQEQVWASQWSRVKTSLDYTPVPTGTPRIFAVKPDEAKLWIWPVANIAYTGSVLYQTIPDVTTISGSTVVDFADSLALVDAIEAFARNCDKDTYLGISEAHAAKHFSEYRVAVEDVGRSKPIRVIPGYNTYRYRAGD